MLSVLDRVESVALGWAPADEPDPWAPLDVRVVAATTQLPHNCSTGDGCGNTCADGASACNSLAADPH